MDEEIDSYQTEAQGIAAYAVLDSLLAELVSLKILTTPQVDALLEKVAISYDPHPGIPTDRKTDEVAATIRLLKSDTFEGL